MNNENWLCVDCSKDTRIDNKDYYMVTDEIREEYGEKNKMLCMNCMETRLGH